MKRLIQLHQRTRRRLGLSAFVLLCLLPTMVILVWGVSRCLPSEETAMEEQLGRLFGLKVTVDAVEHPEPGRVRLRGLVFYRPELKADADSSSAKTSALPVARLETLEIRQRKLADPYDKLRDTICLTGTNLEVNPDELSEVTRLFQEVVDYRLNDSQANVQFMLDRVRFLGKSQSPTPNPSPKKSSIGSEPFEHELSTIQFRLLALEDGPLVLLNFCLVDTNRDTTSQPIRFRVGQKLGTDPTDRQSASLWFDLDTQTEQVPCRLLGRWIPLFDSFGPDARFSGYFWTQTSPDGWLGSTVQLKTSQTSTVAATLSNVDLDTLVGRRFSQVFTGHVDVTIDHASFRSGRIEKLDGRLESTESGTIGKLLLMAAAREMGMQINSLTTAAEVIPFSQLKARFMVDQRGVFIEGDYPGNLGQRPLLLGVNKGTILWESGRMVDIVALLRTLAPGASVQIPAVRSVGRLARRLPVE